MALAHDLLESLLPSYVRSLLEGSPLPDVAGGATGRDLQYIKAAGPDTPPRADALYLDIRGLSREEIAATLRPLRLKIQPFGPIYCTDDCCTLNFGEHLETMAGMGLTLYQGWQIHPESKSPSKLDHSPVPGGGPYLFRYHRARYDPVRHARSHLRALDYPTALEILQSVPDHWFQSDEARGDHAAESLIAQLAQARIGGGAPGLEHLSAALYHYNRACTWTPHNHAIYTCMAAFWRGAGRPDMAVRLLQTVQAIAPTPTIEAELAKLTAERLPLPVIEYPQYQGAPPLRVLFLCHPESDFGSDVLHDGLRRVLGSENVVGYPWKPVLHGRDEAAATGYPCTFNWPGEAIPVEEIARRACAGGFDVVLYSDTLGTLPREETRRLLDAASGRPIFVVDTWDDCGDMVELICRRDGLDGVAGYFKREMIRGCAYGGPAWPLPFAYPDDRIPDALAWEGREGIFWAGKRIGGARRLQLGWLEAVLPLSAQPGAPFSPAAYAAHLHRHLMGLCLPGNGFDTVRYWELPAHGTLLLAERPPIAIPHDFVDGKHAALFETAVELKERAEYYLAHRDEAIAIARAGHAHLREFHTGSARARQVLAVIQARLGELDSGAGDYPPLW